MMMLPVCSAVLCSMTTWDGAVQDLEERAAAAPARAADVLEEVVADGDAPGGLARRDVVAAEDIDARARARGRRCSANVTSSTVDHGAPPSWLRTVKSTANPFCACAPVALEEIALDEHAPRVLELEEVLHRPRLALVPGLAGLPRERLGEVVPPDLDVRRDEVRDRRIGAAEHHVLARRLEVVVHDAEGSRPVPAGDGLRVGADLLEVGEVASRRRGRPARSARCPAARPVAVAVQVAALEDEVVRQARRATRRRRRARPGSSGRRRPGARSRPRRTGSDARPAPRRSRIPTPRRASA